LVEFAPNFGDVLNRRCDAAVVFDGNGKRDCLAALDLREKRVHRLSRCHAELVENLFNTYRRSRALLTKDTIKGNEDAVFFAIVNAKSPRGIIILGLVTALEKCDLARFENESLLKDGDKSNNSLYKIRANEAVGI